MEKKPYVVVADRVDRMKVDDFRHGNRIFDVLTTEGDEISLSDIAALYGTQAGEIGEQQARRILERVVRENWVVLEINPSYGCECLLIAQTVAIFPRHEMDVTFLFGY